MLYSSLSNFILFVSLLCLFWHSQSQPCLYVSHNADVSPDGSVPFRNISSALQYAYNNSEVSSVYICLLPGVYIGNPANPLQVDTIAITYLSISGGANVTLQNFIIQPVQSLTPAPNFELVITQVHSQGISVLGNGFSFPTLRLLFVSFETTEVYNTWHLVANYIIIQNCWCVGNVAPALSLEVHVHFNERSRIEIDQLVWENNTGDSKGISYSGFVEDVEVTNSIFRNNKLMGQARPIFWSGNTTSNELISVILRNITFENNQWWDNVEGLLSVLNRGVIVLEDSIFSCNPYTNKTSINGTENLSYPPPFYIQNNTMVALNQIFVDPKCLVTCIEPGMQVSNEIFSCIPCPIASIAKDKRTCTKCPVNTYSRNNLECYDCPAYSRQSREGMRSCYCFLGGIDVDDTNTKTCNNFVFWVVNGTLFVPGLVFSGIVWLMRKKSLEYTAI